MEEPEVMPLLGLTYMERWFSWTAGRLKGLIAGDMEWLIGGWFVDGWATMLLLPPHALAVH